MSPSQAIVAADWEECERKLREIETENRASRSGVYFRGLPDAEWQLTTTLERRRESPFFVEEYDQLMRRTLPEVAAFAGNTWPLPEWSEPGDNFGPYFKFMPAFGYLAYLRHHGFPSPLMDWSRSPYIAAYFAFAKANVTGAEKVAIFAYSETPNNQKSSTTNRPHILTHGGMALKTHARHFRQQACYTVCVQRRDEDGRPWQFASHQSVFDLGHTDQDRLYKIEVPAAERTKVLSLLERFNLTEFSLFGSEESLMESMAFKWIDLIH